MHNLVGQTRYPIIFLSLILLFAGVSECKGKNKLNKINEIIQNKENKKNRNLYMQMYKVYTALIEVENFNFSKRIFKLAKDEDQLHKGVTNKLVLYDQFGQKWIFKPFFYAYPGGATCCYRLYKLLSINIPETHFYSLKINGKTWKGRMIRFIENTESFCGLNDLEENELSLPVIRYIIQKEILDYLVANLDTNYTNFLMHKNGNMISRIFGIDMDNVFKLKGLETKTVQKYRSLCKLESGSSFYSGFWQQADKEKVEPLVLKNLKFITFVHFLPECTISETLANFVNEEITKKILKRKQSLRNVFLNFYQRNNLLKGIEAETFYAKIAPLFIEKCLTQFREELKIKQKEKETLEMLVFHKQEDIKVITSLESWRLIGRFIINGPPTVGQVTKLIERLKIMQSQTKSKYEKIAIKEYIAIVNEYQLGKISDWGKIPCIIRKVEK